MSHVFSDFVSRKHPRHPNTLAGVIHQPGQYDAVGKPKWIEFEKPEAMAPGDYAAYKQALSVAEGILNGSISDPTGGATFFRGDGVKGGWFDSAIDSGKLIEVGQFGDHLFYIEQ